MGDFKFSSGTGSGNISVTDFETHELFSRRKTGPGWKREAGYSWSETTSQGRAGSGSVASFLDDDGVWLTTTTSSSTASQQTRKPGSAAAVVARGAAAAGRPAMDRIFWRYRRWFRIVPSSQTSQGTKTQCNRSVGRSRQNGESLCRGKLLRGRNAIADPRWFQADRTFPTG